MPFPPFFALTLRPSLQLGWDSPRCGTSVTVLNLFLTFGAGCLTHSQALVGLIWRLQKFQINNAPTDLPGIQLSNFTSSSLEEAWGSWTFSSLQEHVIPMGVGPSLRDACRLLYAHTAFEMIISCYTHFAEPSPLWYKQVMKLVAGQDINYNSGLFLLGWASFFSNGYLYLQVFSELFRVNEDDIFIKRQGVFLWKESHYVNMASFILSSVGY